MGVLIILEPGVAVFSPYALIPLLSATMFAVYSLLTRYVARKDAATVTFFWAGVAGAMVMTPLGLTHWQPMSGSDWGWMAALCCTSVIGHFMMIKALEVAEASAIQPFAYLQLVFIAILGVGIFHETLKPNVIVGAGVVVAPGADIARSAKRIAAARMVNGGQVCVCPDYVLVPEREIDAFIDTARATWQEMFPTILANDDYCSCVNDANFDRVTGLIDDARERGAAVETVAPAGETLPDRASRKIAPTLVRGVDDTMRITDEEIFGPVLTVQGYATLDDAIERINARPAPLVAYWFGPGDKNFRDFVRRTRSGGVARNDFAAQMIPSGAPFGGVGRSGMGAYHGKAGFDAFSHHRTVVGSSLPFSLTGSAAPPFRPGMQRYGDTMLRRAGNKTRRRLRRG